MPKPIPALHTALAVFGLAAAQVAMLPAPRSVATPQYAARAGRTCDNCHVTPDRWKNPRLVERKCTLSCQGCHVDPAGGGMRTVSGRFFGRSTLPMIATSPRPTADWDRGAPYLGRRDRATSYNSHLPYGPPTLERARTWNHPVRDRFARGVPFDGATNRYGFFQGRYGRLRADPLVRAGWDIRLATLWSGNLIAFPMQIDLPVAVHPIHHLTLFANTGARGRRSGYKDAFDDPRTPYFREVFVLLHELPFGTYGKAGRFVPSFGLRLDDHTTRTRRGFGLDGSLPSSRVTGVEWGAAPNYPFVQASYFRLTSAQRQPAAWNVFHVDAGWGAAVNAGLRHTGWGVGGSWMMRRRLTRDGGDTDAWSGYAYVNPWKYWRNFPLVAQVEYDYGNRQSPSGRTYNHSAFYGEADYMVYNGIEAVAAYDFEDPDFDIVNDHTHRIQGGLRVTPYPGVTIDARFRAFFVSTPGRGDDHDMFIQLHLWR